MFVYITKIEYICILSRLCYNNNYHALLEMADPALLEMADPAHVPQGSWKYNQALGRFILYDKDDRPDVNNMVLFYHCTKGLYTERQITQVLPTGMTKEDKRRMFEARAVLANGIQLAISLSRDPMYTPRGRVICEADRNKHIEKMTSEDAIRYIAEWKRCKGVEKMQYDARDRYADELWKQCVANRYSLATPANK